MVVGTALGWTDLATIAAAVILAFVFGYSLTLWPLVASGMALDAAIGLAFLADTLSITVMEIVDNAIMLLIPGAMDAQLDNLLFWGSLALSLAIAWAVAFPVNRSLIARGRGHAVGTAATDARSDQATGPMRSRPPKAGRSTSGIVMLPSGCW